MPKREKNNWANQLVIIVHAVKMLSRSCGATNEELAEELGIDKRTVFRLKKTLDTMGIPVDELDGDNIKTHYKIPSGWSMSFPKISALGLTTPELLALYALRVNKSIFYGSEISQDIDSAFDKIGTVLSPATRGMLEKYSSIFISTPHASKDYSEFAELIEDISFSIIEQKTCAILYHAFCDDTVKKYNINPLHLFERDGGLYLLVVVTEYNEIRTLALERIKSFESTDKEFIYPDAFKPEEFLSSAFSLYFGDAIDVKVRFTAQQARFIRERIWAKEQTVTDEPDGSILFSMKTSGWWDIKHWVLSFGVEAELIEPVEMRDEIRQELAETLNKYAQ